MAKQNFLPNFHRMTVFCVCVDISLILLSSQMLNWQNVQAYARTLKRLLVVALTEARRRPIPFVALLKLIGINGHDIGARVAKLSALLPAIYRLTLVAFLCVTRSVVSMRATWPGSRAGPLPGHLPPIACSFVVATIPINSTAPQFMSDAACSDTQPTTDTAVARTTDLMPSQAVSIFFLARFLFFCHSFHFSFYPRRLLLLPSLPSVFAFFPAPVPDCTSSLALVFVRRLSVISSTLCHRLNEKPLLPTTTHTAELQIAMYL